MKQDHVVKPYLRDAHCAMVVIEHLTGGARNIGLPAGRDAILIPLSNCEVSVHGENSPTTSQIGMLLFVPAEACRNTHIAVRHGLVMMSIHPRLRHTVEAAHTASGSQLPQSVFQLSDAQHITPLLPLMHRCVTSDNPGAVLTLETLGLLLLNEVLIAHTSMVQAHRSRRATGIQPRHLRRIDHFIAENIEGPIRIDELAGLVGLTRTRFMRCFKRAAGISCLRYIHLKRLELTIRLLEEGEESFVQVALAAGFSSQSHFNNLFKRQYGVTPSEFVRRRRNKRC